MRRSADLSGPVPARNNSATNNQGTSLYLTLRNLILQYLTLQYNAICFLVQHEKRKQSRSLTMEDDAPPSCGRGNGPAAANGHATLYRMDSNQSSTSIFEDVEMAHDEARDNILMHLR